MAYYDAQASQQIGFNLEPDDDEEEVDEEETGCPLAAPICVFTDHKVKMIQRITSVID